MEAKELRIGNLIRINFDRKSEIEVEEISSYTVNGSVSDYGYEFEQVEGIPISEDWLLRAGFNLTGSAMRISLGNGLELCYYMQEKIMWLQTEGAGFTTRMTLIQYVHQLQNLCFALTGKELIFTSPDGE